MEYLDAVKKQMEYWKSQIDNIDAEKDKDRYDEYKANRRVHLKNIMMILGEIGSSNQSLNE